MDWLVYPIGDLCIWSFGFLEKLENLPNDLFLLTGFAGMFYWLWLQGKYNKEAAANPNQIK